MIRPGIFCSSWPVKPLSDVVEFLDHIRKPITAKDRVAGPYPYYGANGQQDSVADYLFDEPLILMAEDGGHFGEPDRTIAYRIDGKCWVNNHAHVLRPRDGVDIGFLCRQLERYDVIPFISGTTRAKLTKGTLSKLPITLPPLSEQKRIAAILDKADAIRKNRQQAIALTEDFLRSTFLEMFGDPVKNPKGWENKPLIEIVDPKRPITYGILKPGPDIEDGVPYIRVVDINDWVVNVESVRKTSIEIAKAYKRSKLIEGDLLLSIRGHVGRLALVPSELRGANITQDTARIAANGTCSAEFLLGCIDSQPMQRWMARHTKGVAVQGINLGDVKEMPIPVPPKDVQGKYSQIFKVMTRKVANAKMSRQRKDNLFNSLVQRAFRGEL